MTRSVRALAIALMLAAASPAFADGRKSAPLVVSPPKPLRTDTRAAPQPAPPLPEPAPIVTADEPRTITLPANFGDGGVGAGVNGGSGGSVRVFLIQHTTRRASFGVGVGSRSSFHSSARTSPGPAVRCN